MKTGAKAVHASFRAHTAGCFALMAFLVAMVTGSAAAQETAPAADETATIHGVVLSVIDEKPITQAQVKLLAGGSSVLTDEHGRFEFVAVPFGSANVGARKAGYLCASDVMPLPKCSQSVDVFSKIVDVTLSMLPQAVVSGRIVDQKGVPVEGLELWLMQEHIVNGKRVVQGIGQTRKKTNAEGSFRIPDLLPGSYLLRTSAVNQSEKGRLEPGFGYAATYYPGTTEQNSAQPIAIHAGEEFKVDLSVAAEKLKPVTLSLDWNSPWSSGSIEWGVGSGDQGPDSLSGTLDDTSRTLHYLLPSGKFRLGFDVFPPSDQKTGSGLLWPDGTRAPFEGTAEFTVKDQPVTVTGITSLRPTDVAVHLRTEFTQQEKRKAAVPENQAYRAPVVHLTLANDNGTGDTGGYVAWRADENRPGLAFKAVHPGHYFVESSVEGGAYVASLSCGGVDLLREPLVISAVVPACAVEGVVRDDCASLAITFTKTAQDQLTAAKITVTDVALIPADNPQALPLSWGVWLGAEPQKQIVPPGKYIAFLFDGRQIAWRDPDERKRLMGLGTMVTITPGETKAIQLDWLPELNDPRKQP
jgi:hypothetical protein